MSQVAVVKRPEVAPAARPEVLEVKNVTFISGTNIQNRVAITLYFGVHRERTDTFEGIGNGPIDALCKALHRVLPGFRVTRYAVSSMEEGSESRARASVSIRTDVGTFSGDGIDGNTDLAGAKAVVHALNLARHHEFATAK